jgi:hypothetical protein
LAGLAMSTWPPGRGGLAWSYRSISLTPRRRQAGLAGPNRDGWTWHSSVCRLWRRRQTSRHGPGLEPGKLSARDRVQPAEGHVHGNGRLRSRAKQATVMATVEPTALAGGPDRPDPSKWFGKGKVEWREGGGRDRDDRLPAPSRRGPLPCRLPPRPVGVQGCTGTTSRAAKMCGPPRQAVRSGEDRGWSSTPPLPTRSR